MKVSEKEILEFQNKKKQSVMNAYDLLYGWGVSRYSGTGERVPGYVYADLHDMPAVVSTKVKGREVVTFSGLDLWDQGNLKMPNATIEQAIKFLEGETIVAA